MAREVAYEVVGADHLIPDLLRRHPETRRVLDRHGLHGCGGATGPHETLGFFARAHGVDLDQLLAELEKAIERPEEESHEASPPASSVDAIYRPYFLSGIAVVLTAGASWGAWILWNIALGGSFLGASLASISAHGEAQIYGWVGLFIMGFAYQAFPRMWQTRLAAPGLAWLTFATMLVGIAVRTLGIVTAGAWYGSITAATLGGVLQVLAASIFAGQVLATFRRSGRPVEPFVAFVATALGCFVLSAAYSTWHSWNMLTATTVEGLIRAIATYQTPLRDLQIHGLALLMILGVSIRMVPGLFGVAPVGARRGWVAFGLVLAGLVGEMALFLSYRWSGNRGIAMFLPAAWLAITAGILVEVWPWQLWKSLPERDRSGKFVRAAYGWLGIAMVMLLLTPAYHAALGERFSHAYSGATRHAITVGFISMMIMGLAAKVVPTLNGLDPRTLTSLWGPFVLVNVGCALRVTLQILSDWTGRPTPWIGVSGTLEVAALAWWGLGLAALMVRGARVFRVPGGSAPPRPNRIEGGHRVADVLAWSPRTEEVFVRHGFELIRDPILRRTLARQVTVAQAARLRGVDATALLAALNRVAGVSSLPVIELPAGVRGGPS